MFKKKLVTLAAAVFCFALVTAQESGVKKTTTGLIEDGAIDSLKFGNEDGNGIIFGQYDNAGQKITIGWGNALSDTLWLSVFDSYYFSAVDATETENYSVNATAEDNINIDYKKVTTSSTAENADDESAVKFQNDFGVGVGLNNKLGFQLVWGSYYNFYNVPADFDGTGSIGYVYGDNGPVEIKSEEDDPENVTNTKKEWTSFANNTFSNSFTVNFKGIGIENLGDMAFYAKLNKVYFNWFNATVNGEYEETTKVNKKVTEKTTKSGAKTEDYITPGLDFEVGLNILSNDVSTVKFIYEDDFNMTFNPAKDENSKTTKTYAPYTVITEKNSYSEEAGKYLAWANTFQPKLEAEFAVAEPLQLKAQLALPVKISQEIDEANTYEKVSQTIVLDKVSGVSYYDGSNGSASKVTEKGNAGGDQNKDVFTTRFAPKLSAGFVYQVVPSKFNISFGASAQPVFNWETTTLTNANINTVKTTESKDYDGNVKKSKTVTVEDNDRNESKTTNFTTDLNTEFNLGVTWFFTDAVRFDAYLLNSFGNDFFSTGSAGASLTVLF